MKTIIDETSFRRDLNRINKYSNATEEDQENAFRYAFDQTVSLTSETIDIDEDGVIFENEQKNNDDEYDDYHMNLKFKLENYFMINYDYHIKEDWD